jgi:hypothetical protein
MTNGFIYIVTSPVLLGIKVGKTSVGPKLTYDRYVTPYTALLEMYLFESNDINNHEKLAHKFLHNYHVSGEIFKKEGFEIIKRELPNITNNKQQYYCNKKLLSLLQTYLNEKEKYLIIKDQMGNLQSLKDDEINLLKNKFSPSGLTMPTQQDIINSLVYKDNIFDSLNECLIRANSEVPLHNNCAVQYANLFFDDASFHLKLFFIHYYANKLVKALGFKDILDSKKITVHEMKSNAKKNRDLFEAHNITLYRLIFNLYQINENYTSWGGAANCIQIVSYILKSLYGKSIDNYSNIRPGKDPDFKISNRCVFCIKNVK